MNRKEGEEGEVERTINCVSVVFTNTAHCHGTVQLEICGSPNLGNPLQDCRFIFADCFIVHIFSYFTGNCKIGRLKKKIAKIQTSVNLKALICFLGPGFLCYGCWEGASSPEVIATRGHFRTVFRSLLEYVHSPVHMLYLWRMCEVPARCSGAVG